MPSITVEQSGAFVERFDLPPTSSGRLDGLAFAIKDLIDVAGHLTGSGNPTWRDTHPPADVHAVCVEQLLAAGARAVGKTVTDELAFSLIGENHFYGTPLNAAAPTRVPGGSSSGSASAVACGLVDFALGTDTGGSVRVPASNCGIWGLRPTHGRISVAGVMPFAPTFDTVGLLARSAGVLRRAGEVLLAGPVLAEPTIDAIYLLDDAFELSDAEARAAVSPAVERLKTLHGGRVRHTTLEQLCGDRSDVAWPAWLDTYCTLQWLEIRSSLGAWIAEARPQFGPATARSFELVYGLDRSKACTATAFREARHRELCAALSPRSLLCMPTVPRAAPAKASGAHDRTGGYYRSALSMTSLAGIGRLPQVSMPVARTAASPLGLSLVGAYGQDLFVLAAAEAIGRALGACD